MTDYSKTARTLIYLLSCAVSEKECELKSDEIDFDGLYSLAKRHSLCSAAAFALESAGINEPRFTQAKVKAKRKLALLDMQYGFIKSYMVYTQPFFLALKKSYTLLEIV